MPIYNKQSSFEVPKELVNSTFTLEDVNGATKKLTLISTDKSNVNIVKDLVIKLSHDINGTIDINGFEINDELSSMSGEEVIDIESTLSLNIDVPYGVTITRQANTLVNPIGYSICYPKSTTTYNVYSSNQVFTQGSTIVTGDSLSTVDEIVSKYKYLITELPADNRNYIYSAPTGTLNTTLTVATMTSPTFIYSHMSSILYYFNYDGNSNTTLYFSNNNGVSWSTLDSTTYSYKCVSLTGRLSWVGGTLFRYVDPGKTSVTGTIDLSARLYGSYPTSGYTHASECNGWHFWCPSSSYTTYLYGYNKVKNIAVSVTLNSGMQMGSTGGLTVTYNSTENKYFVFSWNSSTKCLHRIDTDIEALVSDNLVCTGTILSSSVNINSFEGSQTQSQWIPGTNKMMFKDNTTKKIMSTEFSSTPPYYTTPVLYADTDVDVGGPVIHYMWDNSSFTHSDQVIDVYDFLDTSKTIQVRATGNEIKI